MEASGSWTRHGDIDVSDPETIDFFTVEGLFNLIEQTLLASESVTATYAGDTGHPTSIGFQGDENGCAFFTVEVVDMSQHP